MFLQTDTGKQVNEKINKAVTSYTYMSKLSEFLRIKLTRDINAVMLLQFVVVQLLWWVGL